jgi:hypothetical protein
LLAVLVALCWIHEGRHYKKLNPLFKHHRKLLEQFITDFWAFYHKLVAYKKAPGPAKTLELEAQFDDLTARVSGYKDLDERIPKPGKRKNHYLRC